MPRAIQDVIEGIQHQQQHHHHQHNQQQQHQYQYRDNVTSVFAAADVRLTLSFIEIHNDKIRDLLASPSDGTAGDGGGGGVLRIREHPVVGPYVEGVSRFVVNGNVDKALSLISTGLSRRSSFGRGGSAVGAGSGAGGGGVYGGVSRLALSTRSHALVTLEISYPITTVNSSSSPQQHHYRGIVVSSCHP